MRAGRESKERGACLLAALQREAVGAVSGWRDRKTKRERDERLKKRSTMAER